MNALSIGVQLKYYGTNKGASERVDYNNNNSSYTPN